MYMAPDSFLPGWQSPSPTTSPHGYRHPRISAFLTFHAMFPRALPAAMPWGFAFWSVSSFSEPVLLR